jgi:hypothetical protein
MNSNWGYDQYGLADGAVLPELATLLDIPVPPRSRWRAATVVMFATNPLGVSTGYLQNVHDLNWPISVETLLRQAITLLHHRANNTRPS